MLLLVVLVLFFPHILTSAETQVNFKETISKTFTLSFESWTTDRKTVKTAKELQVDISSESKINSPLYLIAVHQKTQRPNPTNPAVNLSNNRFKNAIFDDDDVKVRKYYVEIEGVRYAIMVNYEKNKYLDQFRDIHLFFKDYIG